VVREGKTLRFTKEFWHNMEKTVLCKGRCINGWKGSKLSTSITDEQCMGHPTTSRTAYNAE